MVLQAAKIAYANKTKESITSPKLGFWNILRIANSVLIKKKSAIPTLFNDLQELSSASDKAKLFAINYLGTILSNFLPVFPSGTNLKLNNTSVTHKLVEKAITNLDLSKACGPDFISAAV